MLDLLLNLADAALDATIERAVVIRDILRDELHPRPAMPVRPRLFRREHRRWTLHPATVRYNSSSRFAGRA